MSIPIPESEVARVAALARYKILDTEAEQAFDDFTRLAAQICGTPIALISLIDDSRQWFKSKIGLDVCETAREYAFCAHAIMQPEIFVVSNALEDPRFANNPLVTSDPNIRFYAGAPLVTPEGHEIGTLCVIDQVPRELSDKQIEALESLSRQIMTQFELRRHAIELEKAIAERERIEAENVRLLEQAQKAKLEAENANRIKDEFLAILSHELRTPLNSLFGWVRMLRAKQLNEAMTERALEVIERSAEKQEQLIEDILDVSRIISGKIRVEKRHLDFGEVITTAIDALRPTSDAKKLNIKFSIDPSACTVFGDGNRLEQVISNLLSNAIKFTPENGLIEVVLTRAKNDAHLIVRDTGIGIKPEFLAVVFDRFRQVDSSTKRFHNGLGLGLAIVKHLIELHNGTISVESEGEGKGSTFTVILPLAKVKEKSATQKAVINAVVTKSNEPVNSNLLNGLQVLVVDDEFESREMIAEVLKQSGATVRSTGTVKDAFAEIQERDFDVVISDIAMPGEDGYELIRKLKAWFTNQKRLPCAIALTAHASAEDQARALSFGYQKYFSKPVKFQDLINSVANLSPTSTH